MTRQLVTDDQVAPAVEAVVGACAGIRAVSFRGFSRALWLTSERLAGKQELMRTHLDTLAEHILAPMGVAEVPASLEDATHLYLGARSRLEAEFGFTVSTEVQEEVLRGIAAAH